MTKQRIYLFISLFSFLLLSFVFFFHFHIHWLPSACFLLGMLARIVFRNSCLEIFSFLIPILPAFAALENRGFPLNYLLLPLFFLAGIMAGEFVVHSGKISRPLPELPRFYVSFLLLLGISFIFVILRWSNLTHSPLAFLKDTPVAPAGQRLSFAIIFPVVELALFALSPIYFLLLNRAADLRRVLVAFLSGQSLSIFVSLFQRLQGSGSPGFSLRGLASDATAFGFLSALAVLLSWYLYFRLGCKRTGLLFFLVSLLGILNSATRIGMLAVVLVFFLHVVSAKDKRRSFAAFALLLAASLLLYVLFVQQPGPDLLTRVKANFNEFAEIVESGDTAPGSFQNLASNRGTLLRYSWQCLRSYPLAGVGAGNFVFWVMHAYKGNPLHHLPANQYFFISASTGLIGLFLFALFCFSLFPGRKWMERALLAIFLFFFIFNDYLWFSEIFLVFWLFASLGREGEAMPARKKDWAGLFYAAVFSAFILANALAFTGLHPINWARRHGVSHDYGLYYPESEKGRQFRWTGEKAGIFIYLDREGRNGNFSMICGAPLSRLPSRKQVVDVYWRGKFHKKVVFREPGEYPIRIEDRRHRQGFLEFRVRPAFNLKSMGLGDETRTLGVRLFGSDFPGIQVTAPKGGERWLPGTVEKIRWRCRGNADAAKVEISYDNGATYETIAEPAPGDGILSWTVAGGPSGNCRVRVGSGPNAAAGTSAQPFTIASPPSRSGCSFAAPRQWTAASPGVNGWLVGDFNGDGRSDIMKYVEEESSGEILLSDGSKFVAAGSWTAPGSGSDGWTIGDFNGDGRSDIMRYLSGTSANEVFLSTGSGFAAGSRWLTSENGSDGWLAGDFNGDGRSDLLRYLPDLERSEVFLSTGAAFAASGVWLAENNGSDGWHAGDFNGDGRSDLMRFVPGSSGADVFLSDGTRFVPAGSWAGANPGLDGWYPGDFDGDKKCDIMRYAEWLLGLDVFLSGGTGFYHDGNWSSAGRGDADWLIGDFNGDGRSDLLRQVAAAVDVLLAAGPAAPPGDAARRAEVKTGQHRWLGEMPLEYGLVGDMVEREFFAAMNRRIRGGEKFSIAEIQKEYEARTGRKCRRQGILRCMKHYGASR